MRRLACLLWLCALAAPAPALAQETVFYKCTDAQGRVSMQNGTPCAPGMRQEIRRVGEVKAVPAPPPKPAAADVPAPVQYGEFVQVGGPRPQRTPAPEAAGLPPPPALYQCRTWEGDTYFGETASPPARCAPLQVVGIDGRPDPGLGAACEVKHDDCAAVPDAQLCAAWYRRLDDAEFKLRYASDDTRRARQAEFDAIDARIKASRCATQAPTPAGVP